MNTLKPPEDDIFDVLDISNREDSYTKLIASFFESINQSEKYTLFSRLYSIKGKKFSENIPDAAIERIKWHSPLFRQAVTESERRKKPDLIIKGYRDDELRYFLLLENKILAHEGEQQTYAYTKMAQKICGENKSVYKALIFLTLNGDDPDDEQFKAISYYDLCQVIKPFIRNMSRDVTQKAIDTAMTSLVQRVEGHEKSKENAHTCQIHLLRNYRWKNALLDSIGKKLNDQKRSCELYSICKDIHISVKDAMINKFTINFNKNKWSGRKKIDKKINPTTDKPDNYAKFLDDWLLTFYIKIEFCPSVTKATSGITLFLNTKHWSKTAKVTREEKFKTAWKKINIERAIDARNKYFDKTPSVKKFLKPSNKIWQIVGGKHTIEVKNESIIEIINDKKMLDTLKSAIPLIDAMADSLGKNAHE